MALSIDEKQLLRSVADIIIKNQDNAKHLAPLLESHPIFSIILEPIIPCISNSNSNDYLLNVRAAISLIEDIEAKAIFESSYNSKCMN
ncbi:hypothetical protein UA38_21290 [Photobacterium kishitanii]|uniref:Uncharacterized protein n=1 Tax=Photobacterium kishitanii TaxID=318456 RepID=A0AAX0YQ31_9GAMM|nr:hypothetical protein [Photobacterium kishitanii]KJG55143.1 hypothetical protein UA38_21290 [Photobacterium kishitanii]KJG57313.1 hypothetical protein UA42_21615 [Photobacterium kishitanii]KJG63498.1 hypothetical protein UA40_21680 [Photobacterium kishitanii]KJG69346.1 hypothetical protein UA41_11370 [Photobacterium kishitanii]PSX17600.1 hypothetical protein C0W70_18980 [Photobacterium kishitanii]